MGVIESAGHFCANMGHAGVDTQTVGKKKRPVDELANQDETVGDVKAEKKTKKDKMSSTECAHQALETDEAVVEPKKEKKDKKAKASVPDAAQEVEACAEASAPPKKEKKSKK